MKKLFFAFFVINSLLFFNVSSSYLFANEEHKEPVKHGESEKFKPGPFIMDHIADNHSWHIAEIGHTPISVPLPILLYSQQTGFSVFMSSKFEHGHATYNGFRLDLEGVNKGKIVEEVNGEWKPVCFDFSITKNVFALLFSLVVLAWIFISAANSYKRREGQAPKGIQSIVEPFILFIRDDIAKSSIAHHPERYVPYLLTVFFFIFLNNLFGLIPIFPFGANLTGNIAVTMALALITFAITTFKANKNYWIHIINAPGVPWWLKFPVPLMPVVEIIGVFTKPFVLMVRLFANITAGHIIALGFFSLIFIFGEMNVAAGYGISILSVAFTVFMGMLEILVALIQAYVFTLLSALYFGMATEEHH